jgi:hypothetical protein
VLHRWCFNHRPRAFERYSQFAAAELLSRFRVAKVALIPHRRVSLTFANGFRSPLSTLSIVQRQVFTWKAARSHIGAIFDITAICFPQALVCRSNIDNPLAVVRIASRLRGVGRSKIARIDDFQSSQIAAPKLFDPAMAMERRRS